MHFFFFQLFKFLNTLTLNGNLLGDIEDVIDELKKLKYLKTLSLFSNPIAQEDNYRLRIIAEIPWVETLDRITVNIILLIVLYDINTKYYCEICIIYLLLLRIIVIIVIIVLYISINFHLVKFYFY